MKTLVSIATAALLAGAASAQSVDLNGAGATFPNPIYDKWFKEYAAKTGVKINYQSIGSGGGVRQISEQTVDFGASDAPMTDDELSKAKGGKLLHFPTVMGGDVVVFNLAGVRSLKLTGDVIADIFMGKITQWNDARLVALNPGVKLPASAILVVHRSDGSGTTYIWTDYLSTVSPEWAKAVGKGKDVQWPVGLGGKGNEGVAGQVKQTPGSVGYVELAYARQNKLAYAAVRNQAGNFVEPTIASITAAAANVAKGLPAGTDYRISIINAPGKEAYPISSMTWLLVYENQGDAAKGKKLVEFMRWMYRDGQKLAPSLDYAPLPSSMVARLEKRLSTIKMGGTAN
jgi:phosphate transport system substrate-binding protein